MIELLSEYYARMTEQIFAYQGMLKEYVGDELMAILGAPIAQPDHAERACAAALAMREHRNALREEWTRLSRPPLIARTGSIQGSCSWGTWLQISICLWRPRRPREPWLSTGGAQ